MRTLSIADRPSRRKRASSSEWRVSGPSSASASAKMVAASSNETSCLARFAAAFLASHSNTHSVYTKPWVETVNEKRVRPMQYRQERRCSPATIRDGVTIRGRGRRSAGHQPRQPWPDGRSRAACRRPARPVHRAPRAPAWRRARAGLLPRPRLRDPRRREPDAGHRGCVSRSAGRRPARPRALRTHESETCGTSAKLGSCARFASTDAAIPSSC